MVSRSRFFLALGAALLAAAACSLYSPSFTDCSVKCGDNDACPAGTTCNDSFCRPVGFKGACTCNPGDQVTCGGGKGECTPGVRNCLDTRRWGPCLGEVKPAAEVCDGKDNDCDGTTDEDPIDAPFCPLTEGVCRNTYQACIDGGYSNTCDSNIYGGSYEVTERTCDNLDNDCDGVVDARQAVRLLTGVAQWAVAPLENGFVVFTSSGSSNFVNADEFDTNLQHVGTTQQIDIAGQAKRLIAGGWGDQAVLAWVRSSDNVAGFTMWERGQAPAALTTTFGGQIPSLSVAMTTDAGAVAAFSVDGGVLINRWRGPGPPTSQFWLPLVTQTNTVKLLQLTSSGRVLIWDGDYYPPDGGSSRSVGGAQRLDGSRQTQIVGFSDGVVVETPSGGLQQIDGYSNYISIIFMVDESGMNMCFDLWAGGTCRTVVQAGDHLRYSREAATLVGDNVVVGWLDYNYLTVGTTLPTVQQVRARSIYVDGGAVADYALTAPQDAGLLGVIYRPQSDPDSVYALMMCPP